jgi:hypothetical protein
VGGLSLACERLIAFLSRLSFASRCSLAAKVLQSGEVKAVPSVALQSSGSLPAFITSN